MSEKAMLHATVSALLDGRQVMSVNAEVLASSEATRRCALAFNPSAHMPTARLKAFFAAAMQAVDDERQALLETEPPATTGHGDAMRCFATAMTHLEAAQMFAVKGLHARANAGE